MTESDTTKTSSFARHLLDIRRITAEELEKAAALVNSGGAAALERALVEIGAFSEEDLLEEFHRFYGVPRLDFEKVTPDRELTRLVSPRFANDHTIIPVRLEDGALFVAVSLPLKLSVMQDLSAITGYAVKPLLAKRSEIISAIRDHYGVGAETAEQMVREGGTRLEVLAPEEGVSDARELIDAAPVVRFVDQVILEAFRDRATDIHIEPFDRDLRIRYRIDGVLFEVGVPPGIQQFHAAIVSRIKIMASMDIAEKRLPQDGRIKIRVGDEELDMRVATLPTSHGESVGIRLLRRKMLLMDITELGPAPDTLEQIQRLIQSPHGIILVTGPTGSGKTTTLYSFLSRINSTEKKIVTLEDPVEYEIHGITQVQVRPKIELNFANGLRSMLRHDPDVIMVGEMRDIETAGMGVQAALTGHLVFSTLHTNDAPGAVTRLQDMGVMPYLIASSLRAVIAQRLIRVVCADCKEPYRPEARVLEPFGVPAHKAKEIQLWRGAGCERCRQTGFLGRTGIYEVMNIDDTIRGLILERASIDRIRGAAVKSGMRTLLDDGGLKIQRGLTTPEEVLQVTRGDS
ncbi:MAG: ATPase, T2SS/T4P/T4SS family [bacterium]